MNLFVAKGKKKKYKRSRHRQVSFKFFEAMLSILNDQ